MKFFISYKEREKKRVDLLKSALELLSGYRVRFFMASRDITPGQEWLDEIHAHLKEADCLLLVYTDPDDNWDWCFYETGYFNGTSDCKKRIFCLHSSDVKPPGPYERWQNVEATPKSVEHFIRLLCSNEEGCFNLAPNLFIGESNALIRNSIIDKIVEVIGPKPRILENLGMMRISVKTDDLGKLEKGIITGESNVVMNSHCRSIFGIEIEKDSMKWDEFTKIMEQNDRSNWFGQLAYKMHDCATDCKGRKIYPTLPLIPDTERKQFYRPILKQAKYLCDGSGDYEIVFIEIKAPFNPERKNQSDLLFHLVCISQYFYWSVIDVYAQKIVSLLNEDIGTKMDSCMELIRDLGFRLSDLIQESRNRGIDDRNVIINLFKRTKDQTELGRAMNEWDTAYGSIGEIIKYSLDKEEVTRSDLEKLKDLLLIMGNINRTFRRLAARQYHKLLNPSFFS